MPSAGDILRHPGTSSCYLVLQVRPARSNDRRALVTEDLGVDAAQFGEPGVFEYIRRCPH